MDQVWDANKKQPHGMRQWGAFQAKEKKNNPTHAGKRQRCSCEEFKYWLLQETSTLYPLLKSNYLFGSNDLQFEIGMDLVYHHQREGPSTDIPCEVVAQGVFLSWQSRSLGENLQVGLLRTV